MISLNSKKLKFVGIELYNPHTPTIPRGVTAILGPNGAGKSSLARIIEGGWNFMTNDISTRLPAKPRAKIIEFSDIHALTGFKSSYYQQRFESGMNDDTPTVAQLLGDKLDTNVWREMSAALNLAGVVDKRTNHLSSGELRKLLIVNMLFDLPDILILDNPYIGLDAQSRPLLNDAIAKIANSGVAVIVLICNPNEIPPCASTVIPMRGMQIGIPRTAPFADGEFDYLFNYSIDAERLPLREATGDAADSVFDMRKCTVKYGARTILRDVDWHVSRGQCWSLSGPNGCGKSTLLSLVNADNPQAYSNDISIFGRRRGTGESIWDIKKRIGYVSPEMHLYFQGYNHTLADVVAAGLKDTMGFYQQPTPAMQAEAMAWLRALRIEHLAQRRFSTLSYGEQRLGLLARTFIKQPELLILDEPLHGLDASRKRAVRQIIEAVVARHASTLVYVTHYAPEIPSCVTLHKVLQKQQ